MADHFRLDFDLIELLAGVDANDRADHLGHDDHVAEVSLHEVRLLVRLRLLLRLAELLDQAHRLALKTAIEPTASTGVNDIAELFRRQIEETDKDVRQLEDCSLHGVEIGFRSYSSKSMPR